MACRAKDLTGRKFGKLQVIERDWSKDKFRRAMWKCRCDCGSIISQPTRSLLSGHTKSCGCYKIKHGRFRKKYCKSYREYFNNADYRNLEFSLSHRYFLKLTSSPCHYCGQLDNPNIGIDRKDNTKGYTFENSVPCCITCNRAKHTLSYEMFINWIKNIKETIRT